MEKIKKTTPAPLGLFNFCDLHFLEIGTQSEHVPLQVTDHLFSFSSFDHDE